MSENFDIVYQDRKVMAPVRLGFSMFDVESLDAPKLLPAGSTESHTEFHATRFTFRHGG